MRLRTRLRVSPAVWLTPVMAGLVVLYIASSVTFEAREPYALSLTARSMNALGMIVPVFAAAAAWEGTRLVFGGVWQLAMVRHRVTVATWSILPAIVGGAVVLVVAALLVVTPQGILVPEPLVLLAVGCILVAQVAAGFAIGTRLPRSIAIPVVLLVSFMSFVLPRVAGSAWLRHLSGTSIELCCGTDEALAMGVVLAIVVGSLALVLASVVLVTRHPGSRSDLLAASLPLVVAMAVAMVVAPPSVKPTTVRAGVGDRCLTQRGVEVCLWPEHERMLPDVTRVASEAVAAWTAAGVSVPMVFREGDVDGVEGAARLSVRMGADRDGLLARVTDAVIPADPEGPAPACSLHEPWPSAIAGQYVWAWLTSVAGMEEQPFWVTEDAIPAADLFPDTPPESIVPVREVLARVRAMSPERQARWVDRNIAAYQRCGVMAPLDPLVSAAD
jgi:hypothetical protein